MKAIINWIVLIPVLVLAVGVELFTSLNPTSAQNFFGMDANGISEIIIFALVALFALFFILSLFDRKTSPVHILKHNYSAGIFGIIAAFSLAGDTAATVAEAIRGAGLGAMDIIVVIVSALAAVSMLLVGINHCTASNTKNNVAVFYLSIPLWCAVHLLSRFMSHTATPVAMAETMDLVMYVFLAIYFMYAMMVISLINGKNPVKAAIYWGAPASVASLVYAASIIGTLLNSEGSSVFDYLDAVTCAAMGLYILSFIAELSFKSKTKDEQLVLETEDSIENPEEESDVESKSKDNCGFVAVSAEDMTTEIQVDEEDSAVEVEINQTMKKYFDDIASVESEIEPDEPEASEEPATEDVSDNTHDYGSYFDTEENDNMYIESENIAVDTTKKHFADKSKYPVTGEKTVQQHAVRDEYVVGLDEVDNVEGDASVKEDISEYVISKSGEESAEQISKAKENYEARLDEIDRLIISIQGEANE